MDWEQKLEALSCLGEVSLMMRQPGNWYVHGPAGVEIKEEGCLASPTQRGATPRAAVEECWIQYTKLAADRYLVVNAMARDSRRHIRWNGFMWQELEVTWKR